MDETWKVWVNVPLNSTCSEIEKPSLRRFILEKELSWVFKTMKLSHEGKLSHIFDLDKSLKDAFISRSIIETSKLAASHQLRCLSPLSDHIGLKTYRKAIRQDICDGYQPIVYGLFFDAYSIPMCQGLSFYADQYRKNLPGLFEPLDNWNNQLMMSINQAISDASDNSASIKII